MSVTRMHGTGTCNILLRFQRYSYDGTTSSRGSAEMCRSYNDTDRVAANPTAAAALDTASTSTTTHA
jgi:hypothetical protein